jgi:PIN domain nuclease of toxin-antitoxin system
VNVVLDACAVIAFLRGETGAMVVRNALADPQRARFIHGINACEIYYDYMRTTDQLTAQQVIQDLLAIKINIRSDMDVDFWQVGKSRHYSPNSSSNFTSSSAVKFLQSAYYVCPIDLPGPR